MAVNATASPLGFSEFIHHTMPEAWTSMVTFLVSYLGEAGAWVLLTFGSSYAITFYNNVYFNYIYTNGLHEKYRIQNDRRLPKLLEDMAWEKTFGLTGLIGIILVGMPQQFLGYFVMTRIFGLSIFSMPKSYSDAAWQFFIGTFAWDSLLFWVHYGLHQIPWLYKNVHKRHHEVKTVSTVIAGHAYLIDLLLMDFLPTRFGMIAAHMSFPVLFVWNCFYSHIALRAHCGYALPWDPLNWIVPYVENHDFHHRRTHANYETFFFVWDWLVGGFGDFWEWRQKRWDPKQWKDGVGFVKKEDRARDGTDAIWGETVAELEKIEKDKKK